MMKKVLIIFGGRSYEHDISIVSTFQCLKAFDEYLYDISLVYIDMKGEWKLIKSRTPSEFLKERDNACIVELGINDCVLYKKMKNKLKKICNIDIVFPIVHGINSEDGNLAGYLNTIGIPFVGCDNVSSSIGIDKEKFKKVCTELGVLNCIGIDETNFDESGNLETQIADKIIFPCIIKPNRLGSSIGINICKNNEDLIKNIKKSLSFDKKVIVEPYINKMREFNISLFDFENETIFSEIEEPFHNDHILSFNDKYLNFQEQYNNKEIPAKISLKLKNDIFKKAKECYKLCGCSGVVRVDFIYDVDNKKLYLNEINTIPGALALYLFEAKGIDKKDVINKLIHETLRIYEKEKNNTIEYCSGVLKNKNLSKFNKW